jgi:tetratricopeptide (TPR) repeat protein
MFLCNLGEIAHAQGDDGRAVPLYEECLGMFRELGFITGVAWVLGDLGDIARRQGDDRRAATLLEECLALAGRLGDDKEVRALALTRLGRLAHAQGDDQKAAELFARNLAQLRMGGDILWILECLEGLAATLCSLECPALAARLFGAAAATREAIGAPVPPCDRAAQDHAIAAVQTALGDTFALAWAAGRALGLEEAVSAALAPDAWIRPMIASPAVAALAEITHSVPADPSVQADVARGGPRRQGGAR